MNDFNYEQRLAYKELKYYRHLLNKQQITTLKGQIKAGDVDGAMRGLRNIIDLRSDFEMAHAGANKIKNMTGVGYTNQFQVNLKYVKQYKKKTKNRWKRADEK